MMNFRALCIILIKRVLQDRRSYDPGHLDTELTAIQHIRKNLVPSPTRFIVVDFVRWGIMIRETTEAQVSIGEALVSFARIH